LSLPITQSDIQNKFLQDKTALVTGASRGIGKAIALKLASCGANLLLLARNQVTLNLVEDQVKQLGVECQTLAVDLGNEGPDEESLREMILGAGEVDILINNAGISESYALDDCPDQRWDETLLVNLISPALLSKITLEAMQKKGWGRIINISSISGKMGEVFAGAYSASKFGIIGLTESIALITARHGITVNAICPGWVLTDMAEEVLQDPSWCAYHNIPIEESIEIARLSIPQERFIEPEEIADLTAFLCTEGARGITGQSITVCGGLTLR
jgi:3-hydroxybutyrate dehydrogenase